MALIFSYQISGKIIIKYFLFFPKCCVENFCFVAAD